MFEFEPSLFRWLICLIFIVPDNCEILRTFNHLFASLIQTKIEGIRKGSPSEPTTREDTSGFMQCNRPKKPWFILSPPPTNVALSASIQDFVGVINCLL